MCNIIFGGSSGHFTVVVSIFFIKSESFGFMCQPHSGGYLLLATPHDFRFLFALLVFFFCPIFVLSVFYAPRILTCRLLYQYSYCISCFLGLRQKGIHLPVTAPKRGSPKKRKNEATLLVPLGRPKRNKT